MFEQSLNRGFAITFDNGWTVSVQWGPGTYSNNYDQPFGETGVAESNKSFTAEVAAWDKDGNWKRYDNDAVAVKGWLTSNRVLDFMNEIASIEGY